MRLMAVAGYRSAEGKIRIIVSILITFFLTETGLYSQTYRLTFRNTPLSDALISISSQLNIKVAFDSKKLGAKIIDCEVTGQNAAEVISDLLKNTGFNYRLRYNRYLIVESESSSKESGLTTFQIIGSVSDRNSGEQLPYATIIAFDQDLQTSASVNGSFGLQDIVSNPLHLLISYIGYNPLDTTILLTEPLTRIDLSLMNSAHILDTIEIKGSRAEMVELRNDVDFATSVNMKRLTDLPALAETDVFRMLQVLPGITYGENAGGLSIRGGYTDQNLVLFDGQTLYNLSHYYGMVSALNPNVIKDLQIYKGGYDSRFGERVSGIIDITGKSGNQSDLRVYGDLNLLSANLTAEIPLGQKVSVIGAVRRSYADIYSTRLSKDIFERNMNWFHGDSSAIISQTKPEYYFYDYNTKVTYRPDNMNTLSLSLYGARDKFMNSYSGSSNDLLVNSKDKNTWSNYGFSAAWLKQWNESLYSAVHAGISGYDNESLNSTQITRTLYPGVDQQFLPDSINEFNTNNLNKLKDYFLSDRNTYRFSGKNQLDFGFLLRNNSTYYYKDSDREFVYDNMNQDGWTLSTYVQDRIMIGKNLVIKPGFRVSYFTNTKKWYSEPRFSANYTVSDAFSIRIAAGRYYQYINRILTQQETGYNRYFWAMADNGAHPVVSSNHYIGGFTLEKGKILFDAEGYYKTYSGLQEYLFVSPFLKNSDFDRYFPREEGENPPPPAQQPSLLLTGTGHSYGVDLMLRYKGRMYTSWLSLTLGRSIQNYPAINSGDDIPSPVDQPFQLSWTNLVSRGRWNFSTMTLLSSGKPFFDKVKNNFGQPEYRIYKRLPDYFRSDLSVNYSFPVGKVMFKPGIALINLFNTHNFLDVNTRRFDFESGSFSEVNLIQSQAFSINAFIHFDF